MESFVKSRIGHLYSCEWGDPGIPLLPRSLRHHWAGVELPDWVTEDLEQSPGATYRDLGRLEAVTGAQMERVLDLLRRRVKRESEDIRGLIVLDRDWPAVLDPIDVPWEQRTFNMIARGRLLGRLHRLREITYGDLLGLQGVGPTTVLDFACLLEATLDCLSQPEEPALEVVGPHGVSQEPVEMDSERGEVLKRLSELKDLEWLGAVSRGDPRFESLLPREMGSDTLLEQVEGQLDLAPLSSPGAVALLELIEGLEPIVDRISHLKLEDLLEDYYLSLTGWDLDRLRAFYKRLGWSPQVGETLEEIGGGLGVSRERARQLEKRLVEGAPPHEAYMPALVRAISVLSDSAPCSADQAAEALRSRTVSSRPFRPEGVIRAAEIFGCPHDLSVVDEGGEELLTAAAGSGHVSRVRQLAERQARASGASTVAEVQGELATEDVDVELDEVRGILGALSHMRLDESGWFVVDGGPGNRIVTVARKLLSVAHPLPVRQIRDGLRREIPFRKTRGTAGWPLVLPPSAMVEEALRLDPNFLVDDEGRVSPREPLEFQEVLGDAERTLVEVFRASPSGVLDRQSVMEGVENRGGNLNTAAVLLTYSCLIRHLGVDLWSLRPVEVDPAAVEAVRRANSLRPRPKRVLGHSWSANQELVIAVRVPARFESMVFGIPSSVLRFVEGRTFAARTESGLPAGSLTVYDKGLCGGFIPFLRSAGAEEGDVLVLEFQVLSDTVSLRLESEEIFDTLDLSGPS